MSRTAKWDEGLWARINDAFKSILKAFPGHFFDEKLLEIGLKASELGGDTKLVRDLISMSFSKENHGAYHQRRFASAQPESEIPVKHVPVSLKTFRKALETCLKFRDVESTRSILQRYMEQRHVYPSALQASMQSLALLGFAAIGEVESARATLLEMRNDEMNPR